MKVNQTLRVHSKRCGFRLVTFAFQTQRGGTVEFEGCVTVEDAARLAEILREISDMCEKAVEKGPNP